MNILFINHFAGIPKKNESSLRHYYIAKELEKNEFNCSIITSSKSYQTENKINNREEVINNIKYFFVDEYDTITNNLFTKFLRMFSFSYNLYWYLLFNKTKHKADYVFSSSPDLMTCFVAYYFAKRNSAKFIFEIRDIWPLSQIELHNFSKKHPVILFLKKIENFLHKNANIIISNLPNYKTYLDNYKIDYKQYYYLPQMIDFKYYDNYSNKENLLPEHNNIFKSYKNVGVYAGTIGSYYGIEHMINSLNKFSVNDKNNLAMILIGDGDYKKEAIRMKNEQNIKNLFIIDTKEKSYLFTLLKKSSFGIVSFPDKNIYKYGIASLKMLDYLYCGVPILMIGSFEKYSVLKKSKHQYKSEFGNIDSMVDQYNYLCSLNNEKKTIN